MVVSSNQVAQPAVPVEVPVLPQVAAPGDGDLAGLVVLAGLPVYGRELLIRLRRKHHLRIADRGGVGVLAADPVQPLLDVGGIGTAHPGVGKPLHAQPGARRPEPVRPRPVIVKLGDGGTVQADPPGHLFGGRPQERVRDLSTCGVEGQVILVHGEFSPQPDSSADACRFQRDPAGCREPLVEPHVTGYLNTVGGQREAVVVAAGQAGVLAAEHAGNVGQTQGNRAIRSESVIEEDVEADLDAVGARPGTRALWSLSRPVRRAPPQLSAPVMSAREAGRRLQR